MDELTKQQAQKIVLHSQRLPASPKKATAKVATLAAIEHLGYVQIDTISVICRAHHHTLWSRNPTYQPEQLQQLVASKDVFEYWAHAASYLPMRDYRFSLVRKHAMKSGAQKHWFARDEKMIAHVHERIANEGPLQAKDFAYSGAKLKEWQTKPAKQALEYLFMQGDLMIASRRNFHKVYDLTERVLPATVDDSLPTQKEYARFLITSFLRSNGVALADEFGYLRKQIKPVLRATLQEMLDANDVILAKVDGTNYYLLPESLALLDKPLARKKLAILSPFDNLVIQRKRMRNLFDFDYQIECYVPKAKRVYGYFVLPILWRGRLAARIDLKADRKTQTLYVLSLHLEDWVTDISAFREALTAELQRFMIFNNCVTMDNEQLK